ncbi:response regulator [Roseobacter weihaiensis]|uniref:response regulator n=1 Tax=Roseobacter weihaiensis TaxID=2763262 RepID=UPI001D09A561|nr:response regulator [Roseobacter sp. H9]
MSISVLIVDDNEMDRYLLRRNLAKCSFEIATFEVADGQSAIEYFEERNLRSQREPDRYPPLIIFLDINMPRVDGFEFLERFNEIRAANELESTVIVMFTSSPRQEDKDRSQQWSFVKDFIIKGEFSSEDLNRIILNLGA